MPDYRQTVFRDRVKVEVDVTGTADVVLSAGQVAAGYQTWAQAFPAEAENLTGYGITDTATGDWEVGVGNYNASTDTLERLQVHSSSLGTTAKVSFPAGTKDVFCTFTGAMAEVAARETWRPRVLTTYRFFYVRPDGNDANTGLADTPGEAWATFGHAWNEAVNNTRRGVHGVYIFLAEGTYALPAGGIVSYPPVREYGGVSIARLGTGTVTLQGDGDDAPFDLANFRDISFRSITFDAAGAWTCGCFSHGDFLWFNDCTFANFADEGVNVGYVTRATFSSTLGIDRGVEAPYTALYFYECIDVNIRPDSITTTSATALADGFIWAESSAIHVGGPIDLTGATITGPRYQREGKSPLYLTGIVEADLPGDAAGISPGTTVVY